MTTSFEWHIAARYLRSKRKTKFVSIITVISIGGVAVGVMALIIVLAVMNGFESDLRDKILGLSSHLTIRSVEGAPLTLDEAFLEHVKQQPLIETAEPVVKGKAMIIHQQAIDGIQVQGIDPQGYFAQTLAPILVRGSTQFYPDIDTETTPYPGIVLGKELANRLGVILGDVIVLASPKGLSTSRAIITPKMMKFRLVGVFDIGYFEYNHSYAYIPRTEAQRLFNLKNQFSTIECRTAQIYQVDMIRKQLMATLRSDLPGVEVRTWMESNKNLFAAMKIEKIAMFLILTLIILVAAFNIVSTLMMVVMEKTKEIGVLKSMGATAKNILSIFLLEGFVIGGLGVLIGTLIGYSVCFYIETSHLPVPQTLDFIQQLPIEMRLLDVVWTIVFAVLITFLAALYPAWRAARLVPVDAIRHDWL
ncbi:MAG: ABC transporter permease [Gemmatimonadetes bacterium]|nr:MAG: ABC transporter permease [Gemmatimonadota bacterium]